MGKILDFKANNTTIGSGVNGLTNVIGPDWSAARNSIANYKAISGLITEAAVNVPRIEDTKVLIEASDINILAYSEDLDLSWGDSRCQVAASTITSPSGSGLFRIYECITDSVSGAYANDFTETLADTTYTYSLYTESVTSPTAMLLVTHSGNQIRAYFDVANGVVGLNDSIGVDYTYIDHGIEHISGNIYRIYLKFQDVTAQTNEFRLMVIDGLNSMNVTVGTKRSFWGAMLSADYSSYIATPGEDDVIREADVITNTVPVGTAPITMTTWIDGVSDGGVVVNQGDPITMVNGTTSIEIDDSTPPTTTVEIEWIDSISAAATGNKIYRDDVEIADIANGVQFYSDATAELGTEYKYEVQAYSATDETTDEQTNVNVKTVTTLAVPTGVTLTEI